MKLNLNSIRPELAFLIISLISGICYLLITPPFQIPDEINHFYKSYQVSNGIPFSQKKDNRLGGEVPKSFVQVVSPFLGLRWDGNSKTNFKTIREQLSVPLNDDDKVFADFTNTALYPPVSYIPQAVSIFILRKLNVPALLLFYGSRLFTLFTWIFFIYLAIRITPVYKWLFTFLALLPMSIFTNMSLNADVVTNILAFVFIAYILKITFGEKDFDRKNYLILLLLTVLLASAKIVYAPLVLLFTLIPLHKFKSLQAFILQFSGLLIIGLATALFWSVSVNDLYIPYQQYNPQYRNSVDLIDCASLKGQTEYILSHGIYIFRVFWNSLFDAFNMYYPGYIGTFGWLDTKLPMWLIHISYVAIFLVALVENNKMHRFSNFQRLILFFTMISTIVILLLSLHLTWDCVGAERVTTIQGRYLIPIIPLLFILFNNSAIMKNFRTSQFVILFSIFLLAFSSWVIYSRYYITPDYENTLIQCDAEEITPDFTFKTTQPTIFLGNGITQSDQKSRSGKYSAQLNPERQFGYTYRFYDGKKGDIIRVEVWRLGHSGAIIVSGDSGNEFYEGTSDAKETDEKGWSKVNFTYELQKNMKNKEIGIYLFNNTPDTCYFDDLTLSISRIK